MIIYLFLRFIYSNYVPLNEKGKWYLDSIQILSDEIIINDRYQNTTNVIIYNCKFDSIRSLFNGGAMYVNLSVNYNIVHLENCKFINCSGYYYGGACYITSAYDSYEYYLTIINCLFQNNQCSVEGAAVYSENSIFNFTGNDFIQNQIIPQFLTYEVTGGGALYLYGNGDSKSLIKDCNFLNNIIDFLNTTDADQNFYGGAISINSKSQIDSCFFENNSINVFAKTRGDQKIQGGTIYCEKYANISSCIFNNNKINVEGLSINNKQLQGGGAIFLIEDSNFINCSFKCNFVTVKANSSVYNNPVYGGAICDYNSNTEYYDCLFEDNFLFHTVSLIKYRTTNSFVFGGGVYSTGLFYDCNFINNSVFCFNEIYHTGGAALGGACVIQRCNFVNNVLKMDNNSLCISHLYGILFMDFSFNAIDCVLDNNSILAFSNGSEINGAIFTESYCTLHNCLFIKNSIFAYGESSNILGGLLNLFSFTQIYSCNFTNNTISTFAENVNLVGDLVYCNNSASDIFDCVFEISSFEISCSLIYFNFDSYSNVIQFKDNKIFIFDSSNVVVFDGLNSNSHNIKFKFDNNCIVPYNNQYFKNQNLKFYNGTNNNEIDFIDAFKSECKIQTQSIEFTQSFKFTESNFFTKTNFFTESNIFSQSESFTKIEMDSNSLFDFSSQNESKESRIYSNEIDISYTQTESSESITNFETETSKSISNLKSFSNGLIFCSETEFIETNSNFIVENSISVSSNELILSPYTKKSEKISKATIIGIVCGVLAAVLIITAISLFTVYKKRKRSKKISLNEVKSKESTSVETKSSRSSKSDNSLSIEADNDSDLDFWL